MKDELPQQSTKEENKAKEAEMLAYLKDKYKQEFTSIEYIPAKHGFNDGYNENVLIAESKDGILVNTKEKLVNGGRYYDDYLNSYASKLIEDKIDFSGIKNLQVAKAYAGLTYDEQHLQDFLNGNFTLTNEKTSIRYSIISISGEADDEVLKDLYGIYEQMHSIEKYGNVLIIAFSGDKIKAEKYVNNFFLYGVEKWEDYDETLKGIIRITVDEVSFEQFKATSYDRRLRKCHITNQVKFHLTNYQMSKMHF